MRDNLHDIIARLQNFLDSSKYKVYLDSFKSFKHYAIVNYQSKSIVDDNIPDDNMIYGIGTLMIRFSDNKIFEIHSQNNIEEQINNLLKIN